MAQPANFLVVDDHPLFLEALQRAIKTAMPDATTVEASSIDAAKTELQGKARFDVVLLDLSMPGVKGFDGLLELRGLYPKVPIVVVSALEDPRIIHEALSCGAAGFIAKSVSRDDLARSLRAAMDGSVTLPKGYHPPEPAEKGGVRGELMQRLQTLTPKQLAVLKMLRQGLLNKQIAHELKIEETTVKAHVSEILRKLNVASRTQAVIEAGRIDFDVVMETGAGSTDDD